MPTVVPPGLGESDPVGEWKWVAPSVNYAEAMEIVKASEALDLECVLTRQWGVYRVEVTSVPNSAYESYALHQQFQDMTRAIEQRLLMGADARSSGDE